MSTEVVDPAKPPLPTPSFLDPQSWGLDSPLCKHENLGLTKRKLPSLLQSLSKGEPGVCGMQTPLTQTLREAPDGSTPHLLSGVSFSQTASEGNAGCVF